jgi:hypothetical protein
VDPFLFYATDAQGVTVHLLVDDSGQASIGVRSSVIIFELFIGIVKI